MIEVDADDNQTDYEADEHNLNEELHEENIEDDKHDEPLDDEPLYDENEAQENENEPLDETHKANLEIDAENKMEASTTKPKASKASSKGALEGIEVCVDFRIGEITMPVNALENLAPGWTLTDLPGITFPRALALSAGRGFAEGELVDIDGKIGFRITKLLP